MEPSEDTDRAGRCTRPSSRARKVSGTVLEWRCSVTPRETDRSRHRRPEVESDTWRVRGREPPVLLVTATVTWKEVCSGAGEGSTRTQKFRLNTNRKGRTKSVERDYRLAREGCLLVSPGSIGDIRWSGLGRRIQVHANSGCK